MCSFQSTFMSPLQCQVPLFYISFIHIPLDFTQFLSPRCFKVISSILGDFKIKQLQFEALGTVIEDETRVSKHSQALQVILEDFTKSENHFALKQCNEDHVRAPFGRMTLHFLGEWMLKSSWLETKPSRNGECEIFGRAKIHSAEWTYASVEWLKKTEETSSKLAGNLEATHFERT